jgi:hypothetical protein
MTIVEFLHPIKDSSLKDICLAGLYFAQRYEQKDALTVETLRALLKRGRIPRSAKLNLADVLAKSVPHVDTSGKEGNRFLWTLTPTGQQFVRTLVNLPSIEAEIEIDVTALRNLLTRITDKDTSDYVDEAIKCLSINALRASVVFLWAGAVKKIRDAVMAYALSAVNDAVVKFDPKARAIKSADDLVYLKESTLLLVSQDLGVFDKNERSVLEDCLDLRNKCGHPGKYKAGPKKVSSFIEDLVGIVFDS